MVGVANYYYASIKYCYVSIIHNLICMYHFIYPLYISIHLLYTSIYPFNILIHPFTDICDPEKEEIMFKSIKQIPPALLEDVARCYVQVNDQTPSLNFN